MSEDMGWVRGHGGSFLASCIVHAVLLFGTTSVMLQPARYEVEAGTGGMEVSLVAAPLPPADGASMPVPVPAPEESRAEPVKAEEWVLDIVTKQPQALQQPAPVYGDGSSPVPGTDPTTLYLSGGAASGTGIRKKNPAPPYPFAAIQQQQEGFVLLQAVIDNTGRPLSVEITQSSGFPLLDQSALRTVRRWKFDAAHIGFLPVQSKIAIPIRFLLTSSKTTSS